MKISLISKIVAVVAFLGIVLGSVGVYANWQYSSDPIASLNKNVVLGIDDYVTWEGSEDLPSDIEGENHALLITDLIFGTESGNYNNGLNNSDSAINDYINDRVSGSWLGGWKYDHFGSMAIVGGDEMTKLFEADTKGLTFIIQKSSDTKMYIYTTSIYLGTPGELNWLNQRVKDGAPNIPIGEYIYAIYRTELTRPNKNSEWSVVESLIGKAKSDWYDESRSNENLTQIPSFDITTWAQSPTMGTAMTLGEAIWTFDGDSPNTNVSAKTTPSYYRMTPKTAGTRTITANKESAKIRIYNASGAEIAESQSGSATPSVSFSASANTLYYISVLGDYQITITINKA